jgi:hypothetical protein
MKKITNEEKQSILEMYYTKPIKSYLFEEEAKVVQGTGGDPWEYKKENGVYFTRKKGSSTWIDVSNKPNAKYSIGTIIFGDKLPKPATIKTTNTSNTTSPYSFIWGDGKTNSSPTTSTKKKNTSTSTKIIPKHKSYADALRSGPELGSLRNYSVYDDINANKLPSDPNRKTREDVDKMLSVSSEIKHLVNSTASIVTLFIPVIGPFISAGIMLFDSYLYYNEGDKKMAALTALLGIIPGVGGVFSKIPGVKKLGSKKLIQIGQKMQSSGIKGLTPAERDAVLKISEKLKTPAGKEAVDRWVKMKANDVLVSGTIKNAKKFNRFKTIAEVGILGGGSLAVEVGAEAAFHKIWDSTYGKSIQELLKSKNYTNEDLEFIRLNFRAETEADMKLLLAAMQDKTATAFGAWDVGYPVPLKYQTPKYKRELKEIVKNLDTKPQDEDARWPGSFGAPIFFNDWKKDTEFKFIDGKFYARPRNGGHSFKNDWHYYSGVKKDGSDIKELEKNFQNEDLVKDSTGYVYVPK